MQNPSLPVTQLFFLYHTAGDNPVAMGPIGSGFAQAFERHQSGRQRAGGILAGQHDGARSVKSAGGDDRAMQLALDRLQFTVPRRYFDEAFGGATPGEDDVIALM